jgi:hypothetical protein
VVRLEALSLCIKPNVSLFFDHGRKHYKGRERIAWAWQLLCAREGGTL